MAKKFICSVNTKHFCFKNHPYAFVSFFKVKENLHMIFRIYACVLQSWLKVCLMHSGVHILLRDVIIYIFYVNFFRITKVQETQFIIFFDCVLGASAGAKSSTLPLPHRLNVEKPVPRERDRGGMDGYYR